MDNNTIYKLYIVRSFREAYYQLSKEERHHILTKMGEAEAEYKGKPLISCDARWCNEAYVEWGVMEYPDLLSVQKVTRAQEEIPLFRYVETESYLGTKGEGFQAASDDLTNALYGLFLIKNQDNNSWESLSQDTRDRIWSGVEESIQKNGGKILIGCDCTWSNEEYNWFGVIAWPNAESLQAHFKDLAGINWHRYIYARTILGTKSGS